MKHLFEVEIAVNYGVNAAILLENFGYWIKQNEANDINYFDGTYWTYNSRRAFRELFPYLSERQINTAIQKLIDNGLIITGNYNKSAYDRTLWYALTPKGKSILHFDIMEDEKMSNEFSQNVRPIPNNKPNSKPNGKPDSNKKTDETGYTPDYSDTNFSPEMIETVNLWLDYKAEQKKAYKPVGLKSLITTIKNKVEQYGEQAVIELITECMGANYQGIIWDKLTKQQPVPMQTRQQPKQPASTGNPFADMLRQMQADKSQPNVVGVYDAKEVK